MTPLKRFEATGDGAMRHTIGASRIAAVMGVDRFSTPQKLWEEMTGRREREPQNEHMTRGLMLEDGLCNWWINHERPDAVEKQVKLAHPNGWAVATPDMIVGLDGEELCVDVKCPAAFHLWNEREDRYPVGYRLQVNWQVGVARADGRYVAGGRLAAGPCFGRLLRFVVPFDEELFDACLSKAEEFLDCVKSDVELPEHFNEATNE